MKRNQGLVVPGAEIEDRRTIDLPAPQRMPESPAAANRPKGRKASAPTRSDLRGDLRSFVGQHEGGWGHDDWLELLGALHARGHNVDDPDQIGADLERERLTAVLLAVDGMGARRVHALCERYGTLWNLRGADIDELMRSSSLPRAIAERIRIL